MRADMPQGNARAWDELHQEGMGPTQKAILLGGQALRCNIGGSDVMRGQLRRVLDSFTLPGVTLGIVPSRARLHVFPGNSFGIFDGKRVEVELFGESPTLTDPEQIRLYEKAFRLLERSAVHGEEAKALVRAELAALGP
ncbi:Scr1 family TA system antitoxin-like transcriptional regulator [Streptomyces venezuelae]|uniref:Scr1 family TA system antitoxin-like transcriptional regulator n=1 Tax=Streptomyces venezuelae TaxID=54571 RepID=UPI0037A7C84C